MRPVFLSMSGLQSYRSQQDIDLLQLGELGLFGIFGPTGSGKSTILDAMTLALYGSVERAPNRIRGIMNNSETTLRVSFTFDIGSGGLRKRYRVDRSYRRGSGDTIGSSRCILCELLGDQEVPLADKERDVNTRLLAIIGLSFEDFTRAVVLPQGKFAEFLTLKGTDRTRMLQRLFSLDEYGQALTDRVRAQNDLCRSRLEAIDGEQKGLGDCSEAAVQSVVQQVQALEDETASRQFVLESLRKEHEEKRLLWGYLSDLQRLAEREEAHAAQSSRMHDLSATIATAKRCEPIRSMMIEASSLELARLAKQEQLVECEAALVLSIAAYDERDLLLREAERQRNEREPSLIAKQTGLERAVQLERDFRSGRAAYDGLIERGTSLARALTNTDDAIAQGERSLDGTRAALDSVTREFREKTVDPQRRRQVADAVRLMDAVVAAEGEVESCQHSFDSACQRVAEAEARHALSRATQASADDAFTCVSVRLSEHRLNQPADERNLRDRHAEVAMTASVVADLARMASDHSDLREILAGCEIEYREARATEERATLAMEAAQSSVTATEAECAKIRTEVDALAQARAWTSLVEQLEEDRPCPLCGSVDHPRPLRLELSESGEGKLPHGAGASADQVDELRERLLNCDTELAVVRGYATDKATELGAARSRVSAVRERMAAVKAQLDGLLSREAAIRGQLPATWAKASVDILSAMLYQERAGLDQAIADLDNWTALLVAMEADVTERGRSAAEVRSEVSVSEAKLHASRQTLETEAARCDSSRLKAQAERAAFDAARGELSAEQVRAVADQIGEWDERCLALQAQELVYRTELAEVESRLAELRRNSVELGVEVSVLRTQATERKEYLRRQKEELDALTAGSSVQEVLEEVEGTLSALRDTVSAAQSARDAAANRLTEARNLTAAARAALDGVSMQYVEAHARLWSAIEAGGFNGTDEVERGLLPAERLRELEEAVTAYQRAGEALETEHSLLAAQVAGRALSEPEWADCRQKLASEEDTYATKTADLAVARSILSRLETDRQRWSVLEVERASLDGHRSRLVRLAGLLRGNAFVQFLAEEHMHRIIAEASSRLVDLTGRRYSLEMGTDSEFMVRDNANGGTVRSVGTLSGGETFLTSLCLALALSSQIQLRGECPLEFFFLDEGFGTLDSELLETVMSTLERLHMNRITIGIISHVPELRSRLARRLIVIPSIDGAGSRLRLELG